MTIETTNKFPEPELEYSRSAPGLYLHAIIYSENPEETDLMAFALKRSGWSVAASSDLNRVLENWSDQSADLLLVMAAEGADSARLVSTIRKVAQCGLLLVLENASERRVVEALNAGADLAVNRPIAPTVLAALATALGRRVDSMPSTILPSLELDEISLDPSTREVRVMKGDPERLTRLEFRLLYTLMTNRGQAMPADVLVERVWGYDGEGDTELVRGLVSRLRNKLGRGADFIETIPGVGYRFSAA